MPNQDVGAHARFGHAHAADPGAVDHARQVAAALFVIAVHEQIVYEKNLVGQIAQRESRVGPAHLLVDDHFGHAVHSGAAELFRDREPEDSQLGSQATKQIDVEAFRLVVLHRLFGQGVHGEPGDHLPQLQVGIRGIIDISGGVFDLGEGRGDGHAFNLPHFPVLSNQILREMV